jgi:glutamine---fructose-6-phosphate transaminase (isomerizing)
VTVPTTDSFMYQTMHRQPAEVRRILSDGWQQVQTGAEIIGGATRVFITGIGTSYHAALVGSWLIRAAGFDARAVLSFDLAHYPESYRLTADDAVIVMAHTGVKTYSGVAMKHASDAGAKVISVGSQSAEHPGSQHILRTVDREKSAAYTASHLVAMTVLAQLAIHLGETRGVDGAAEMRQGLEQLPDAIQAALDRSEHVAEIAREAVNRRVYAAGAGPNEATALELVIKAREAAYGQVDALAAEQFLHGPMVAVNAGDLAVMIHIEGASAHRTAEISAVLDKMGTLLWIVGQPATTVSEAPLFELPVMPEMISPLLAVVPMQMLAYEMAVLKGVHPDTFRRDDPVYQEAFGLLTL